MKKITPTQTTESKLLKDLESLYKSLEQADRELVQKILFHSAYVLDNERSHTELSNYYGIQRMTKFDDLEGLFKQIGPSIKNDAMRRKRLVSIYLMRFGVVWLLLAYLDYIFSGVIITKENSPEINRTLGILLLINLVAALFTAILTYALYYNKALIKFGEHLVDNTTLEFNSALLSWIASKEVASGIALVTHNKFIHNNKAMLDLLELYRENTETRLKRDFAEKNFNVTEDKPKPLLFAHSKIDDRDASTAASKTVRHALDMC